MEKKAKHFIRLLAKKLTENEHEKAPRLQDSGTLKLTFRKALDDLPKSALKTELQTNAATYFRKLEALTKNGRGTSNKRINTNSKGQEETQDASSTHIGSSEIRKTKAQGTNHLQSGQKSSKKNRQKPVSSVDVLTIDECDDEVATVTQRANKMDVVVKNDQSGFRTSAEGSFGSAYNIYATDAKSRVVDSLTNLPSVEKQRLAPHAYAFLCSENSFIEFLRSLQPNGNQEVTSDTFALLKQEILAGLGASDVKVFIRCMADGLSGIITEADKVLNSKNIDRLTELQGFILNFLLWAKIQHEVHGQRQYKQAQSLTNYEDLVAAILSIYVDISVVLSRARQDKMEAEGRHILSNILLFIGHSPIHQLNLLLQVTQPTAQDCQFMLPIYKHMLTRKPSAKTNEIFIKYICAVGFSLEILQNQQPQVLQDILNVAMTVEPSKEFLQWLLNMAPGAYRSLPDSVKTRKVPLVKYLTEQAPKDYLDRLLDIVSDEENGSPSLTYEDSQDDQGLPSRNSQENQVEERPETEGLFFTDLSRDEHLARQVDSDLESVEALHNRLDAIDTEESCDEEDEHISEVVKPPSDKAKGKVSSARDLGGRPLTPQDSDNQSDYEELVMDTSAATEENIPETLSFEELRHNFKMEALTKTTNLSDDTENTEDSAQTRPEKVSEASHQKALSLTLRTKGDQDDVLVIPETQGAGYETDSEEESFTTAKDNLDTTKESIIIDVDDEVTFKFRAYRHVTEELEEVEDENGEEMADEDDGQVLEPPSKLSQTKPATRSPKNSQEIKEDDKKQKQASDEKSGSSQHKSLRSTGANLNQTSLLTFFTLIRKSGEESPIDIQPTQRAKEENYSESDSVEVVPDSCNSADEDEKNPKTAGGKGATPRRVKNLKSLQKISTNAEQTLVKKSPSSATDVAQFSQKQAITLAGKKCPNRLSRSARKMRGAAKQRANSSSDGDADPVLLPSHVINLTKMDALSMKSSEQNCSLVEDAVSEGIRRIRKECVTSPEDLQQPLLTRSASKRKSSKRKSLTITGGIKSKTSAVSTPRQPSQQVKSATLADKAIPKSAEKRQGVSPLSPSTIKRVATFDNTYHILAGISADSQTDPGSLPASQKTSPKRARLQPKSLGGMFSKETPGNQKQSARKQRTDVQPLSASSQESSKSGHSNSSSVKKLTNKPVSPKACDSKMPAITGSLSSQESTSLQAKETKPGKGNGTSAIGSIGRLNDTNPKKATLKRRASLPPSKSSKTIAKASRKSTRDEM